ncbi:IS3 family transposase [Parasedimentitalea psychrophila]|uniref:IS3 family transposase n=1 Tax=Parasedimentitalea psychrophila TaxID=2997337 RepID=UPI0036F27313
MRLIGCSRNTRSFIARQGIAKQCPERGSRQIAAYLPQSGFSAGRHRVRRLMNSMGLQAIHRPAVHVYMHERVQRPKHQQKAPTEQDISIPAEEACNYAAQSSLVQ